MALIKDEVDFADYLNGLGMNTIGNEKRATFMCTTRESFVSQLLRTAKFHRVIDAIHKWLPIHYSFVIVQISLLSLIVMYTKNLVLSNELIKVELPP